MEVTISNLLQRLQEKKFDANLQAETNQITLILKLNKQEFPLFFRIYESTELLQLLTFMPLTLQENTRLEMARVLHLLNKELDIPGFGMDETAKLIFFRAMIPTPNQKVAFNTVERYLSSIQLICQNVFPIIYAVALGSAKIEDVYKVLKEVSEQTQKN